MLFDILLFSQAGFSPLLPVDGSTGFVRRGGSLHISSREHCPLFLLVVYIYLVG